MDFRVGVGGLADNLESVGPDAEMPAANPPGEVGQRSRLDADCLQPALFDDQKIVAGGMRLGERNGPHPNSLASPPRVPSSPRRPLVF